MGVGSGFGTILKWVVIVGGDSCGVVSVGIVGVVEVG
jgi:hypothetical protein